MLSGSGHARDLIWLEFIERVPAAICTSQEYGQWSSEELEQTARQLARDTVGDVGLVGNDWFIGPRALAGKALAGGELLVLVGDEIAWYSAPGLAVERDSELAAVMLLGITLPDGRTAWWRSYDTIEVFLPPCPDPP